MSISHVVVTTVARSFFLANFACRVCKAYGKLLITQASERVDLDQTIVVKYLKLRVFSLKILSHVLWMCARIF